MTRVALLTPWMLVALVLAPVAAHARAAAGVEPAICDETSQPFVFSELLVEGRPLEAVRLDATRGEHAENADDAPPAWCLTPDDPRCAPRDASAPFQPQTLLVPMCGYEEGKLPQLRALEPARVPRDPQLGAALPGTASRVERPPRA